MGESRGLLDKLSMVGEATVGAARRVVSRLAFLGEGATALGRWSVGRARFRARDDLLTAFVSSGPRILPLVIVIGFLLGLISSVEIGPALGQVGVVSKLPAFMALLTMREAGALLAALVLAGQIPPALAVELGTLPLTDEGSTEGTTLTRVLPRLLATCATMPLVCLYSEASMVTGAAVGGLAIEGITVREFLASASAAIAPVPLLIGLTKSAAFGFAIALPGCAAGLHLARERVAAALGERPASLDSSEISDQARRASAASIFWILALDGVFDLVTWSLGA